MSYQCDRVGCSTIAVQHRVEEIDGAEYVIRLCEEHKKD